MQIITDYLANLWAVAVDAAPWLLLGLLAAGLIKAFVPTDWMARWLGRRGLGSVLRAAVIGTPLPLCSCGVLPAALGVRRQGASKGATISFLVATPQNGADSIAISYALLGPFLMIAKPVASLFTAVFAGALTDLTDRDADQGSDDNAAESCGSCCDSKEEATPPQHVSFVHHLAGGVGYALGNILDDLGLWLAIGLAAAAAVTTFIPPDALGQWGSGIGAMAAMVVIGIPMYICATASIPLAGSMLLTGVSPGTVVVFLIAGPGTNLATIAVIKRELGTAAMAMYLVGLIAGSIAAGYVVDMLIGAWGINVIAQVEHTHEMLPPGVGEVCVAVLVLFAIRPLRRMVIG